MSDDTQYAERKALEKVLLAHLDEQRRSRRWGIFFKSLAFVWLFVLLIFVLLHGDGEFKPTAHTALIEIQGEIGSDDGVLADDIIAALGNAFADKRTRGVVLRCNSPGGSPVHAGQIHDEILRLRAQHPDLPVHAVVDDLCASGGYYIIAAADNIYVDKASILGSIGVLMDGFGFTEGMKKLGIERRLLAAGESKGFLDPFSPLNKSQVAHVQSMLDEIHQQFIEVVRAGRGERLRDTPGLFSGLVWSGARSVELGLADDFGNLDRVAREVVQAEEIVDYTPRPSLADRLAHRIGTEIGIALSPVALSVPQLR